MAQYDSGGLITLQNAVSGTGNGSYLTASGYSVAGIAVSGTFVGTIALENTIDGTNWNPLNVSNAGTQAVGTIITATGFYRADIAGVGTVRARVSAYTSGTLTVTARADSAPFGPLLVNAALPQKIAGEDLTNDVMKVEQQFTYGTLNGTSTVTFKTGAGEWHGLTLDNPAFGTPGSIVIWDNTAASGTAIDTFAIPIGTTQPYTILKDVKFVNGLTVSVSGTTVPVGGVMYR